MPIIAFESILRSVDFNAGGCRYAIIVDEKNVSVFPEPINHEIASFINLVDVFDYTVWQAETETLNFTETAPNELGTPEYNPVATFIFKKDNLDLLRQLQKYQNKRVVALVQDQNGLMRIIGRPKEGAKIVIENRTTGTTPEERNHYQVTISGNYRYPAPIYTAF